MEELPGNSGTSPHDVLGGNPFPEDDPRHQYWTQVSLWVKEKVAQFTSRTLKTMPPEAASYREFLDWSLDAIAGIFDIRASGYLALYEPTDQDADSFESLLCRIEEFVISQADAWRISSIPAPLFLTELKIRAAERKQYWIGQMLLSVRKRNESWRTPRDFVDAAEPKPDESARQDARPANASEAVFQTLTSKPSTPTPREGRMVQEQPKQDAPERIDDGPPPTGTVPVPEQPQTSAAIPEPAVQTHAAASTESPESEPLLAPEHGAAAESAIQVFKTNLEIALRNGKRKEASEIWMAARKVQNLPATKAALYDEACQDKAEYYRWERGELKEGSQADIDIRKALLAAFK
jgi:hypothetical protein